MQWVTANNLNVVCHVLCTLLGPDATSIQAAPYDPEPELGRCDRPIPHSAHIEDAFCWWSLDFQGDENIVLEWAHEVIASVLAVVACNPSGTFA